MTLQYKDASHLKKCKICGNQPDFYICPGDACCFYTYVTIRCCRDITLKEEDYYDTINRTGLCQNDVSVKATEKIIKLVQERWNRLNTEKK